MATLAKTPQRRQIPDDLIEAVRRALVLRPGAAAAFVWEWEDGPLTVTVVLEDELLGTHLYTRELTALFPGMEIRYSFCKRWRKQDGIAGYEQIYLRP